MTEHDPVLVNEAALGIEGDVEKMEAAYQVSCQHNGVPDSDIRYLREYLFVNVAILSRTFKTRVQAMQLEIDMLKGKLP